MTTPQKRVDDEKVLSDESIREAEDIFNTHLKRVGLKHTGQRDAILRTFLETHEHLSTEELHHLVQRTDPGIGFTTVYRTLKLFAECGLASEVAFHDGVGSVEFFSPEIEKVEKEIGRKHRYQTTSHTFQVYGLCSECQKKKPAPRAAR
jgi:Fur family ferric uptake transcriptional regulator